jgi:hypothetical protein
MTLTSTRRRQSFFLSWGANFNYLSGFEYLNIFPLFDWRRVPGTTPGAPGRGGGSRGF